MVRDLAQGWRSDDRENGLYPNSISLPLRHTTMGIPLRSLHAIFAISRISGWTGHVLEQYADNKLIRPRAEYVGARDAQYVRLVRDEDPQPSIWRRTLWLRSSLIQRSSFAVFLLVPVQTQLQITCSGYEEAARYSFFAGSSGERYVITPDSRRLNLSARKLREVITDRLRSSPARSSLRSARDQQCERRQSTRPRSN